MKYQMILEKIVSPKASVTMVNGEYRLEINEWGIPDSLSRPSVTKKQLGQVDTFLDAVKKQ